MGLVLSIAAPAGAQIIRERVGACTIEAPASLERQAKALAVHARDILPRLERQLGVRPAGDFRIVLLGPNAGSDPLTARLEAAAPEWAAGFMLPEQRVGAVRVAQASRYPYGTIEAVFAHEVVHLLIHDGAGGRVPRWFNEGVATRAGRQWSMEDAFVYTTSLLTASLPPLQQIDVEFQGQEPRVRLAYAASSSFVSWAQRNYGEGMVADVLSAARTRTFENAWRWVTGVELEVSEAAWRREALLRYRWLPALLTAGGVVWAMLGFLTMIGGIRKKARLRAQRAQWAVEEAEALAALHVEAAAARLREESETDGS